MLFVGYLRGSCNYFSAHFLFPVVLLIILLLVFLVVCVHSHCHVGALHSGLLEAGVDNTLLVSPPQG